MLEARWSRTPERPAKFRMAGDRRCGGWIVEDEVGGDRLFRASRAELRRATFIQRALGRC